MSTIFTEFVRALEPDGAAPTPAALSSLMRALKGVLRSELKRRGLWNVPPSYLGVLGSTRWLEGQQDDAEIGEGALDELAMDCYTFVFVDRLRSLKMQLRLKPNIDGVVFLSLRNFLHDAQKRNDPLGFRVFQVAHGATLGMVKSGQLRVVEGDTRVRNATIVAFSGGHVSRAEATKGDLATLIPNWVDDLLPDIVTARGSAVDRVIARLRERLSELPAYGIRLFLFGDLVGPLKQDIRARWSALFAIGEPEGGNSWQPVFETLTGASFEDRQSFDHLLSILDRCIEELETSRKTRAYLKRLLRFLSAYAIAEGRPETLSAHPAEIPSRRRLAAMLGIPRDRLPELFATLGHLLDQSRARPEASKLARTPAIASPTALREGGTS